MASTAGQAVLAWIHTFPSVTTSPTLLADLTDGNVFLEILAEIDPKWFKISKLPETGDNWVLKFNNIKRLFKLISSYFEEFLGQNIANLDMGGSTLEKIAKGDPKQVLRLAHLVIALAVQTEGNQKQIAKIQSLNQFDQHELMVAIETVMASVTEQESNSPTSESMMVPQTAKAQLDLEASLKDLHKELTEAKRLNEQLIAEKQDDSNKIADLDHTLTEFKSAGNVDFLLRSEIDHLKAELEKSETTRLELETISELQEQKIGEATKKVDHYVRQAEEMQHLSDQLDELRHAADKLQKSEAMVDKYKKKIDETIELKRSVKALEEQLVASESRNSSLEEEFRKANAMKSLVDTYKKQIGALEEKASTIHVENTKLSFLLSESDSKVKRYDAERSRDQDLIHDLQERMRDLEFSADIGTKFATEIATSEEAGTGDAIKSHKIVQLEQEIARLRQERSDDSVKLNKVIVLETLLEDTNRLKTKLEEDYRRMVEVNMGLESQLKEPHIHNSMGTLDSGIMDKLNTYEAENARLKARLSIPGSVDGAAKGTVSQGSSDSDQMRKKMDQLLADNRSQSVRINNILIEKESLQSIQIDLKERMQHIERVNSELRSSLAAMETKGQSSDETTQKLGTATQRLVQLTDQNVHLQDSLKKAKEHILNQEKKIRNLQESDQKEYFNEALQSLQSTMKLKEMELERAKKEVADTRAASRREQRLVVSAWYELGTKIQQKTPGSRAKDSAPSSWLAQQRQNLDTSHAARYR
ncbi:hypothetical protein BASA50_010835 [Batrachochytrium salamandrivorans]|uniref:Calponin-homology (CH) domain-containing protein n=1 Tax=Batrachochytrium salamandrivorans TaxID=1357716 RepID=A0ABQ8EXE0_9FUNG|nr:hypothetical protein BASA60_002212 [Batrachochytrium salamandrivorans]KAH6588284.1 hypothetical protein BASA50_010835 [Batrachochytrium salamandrivorans]KAH9267172.1 hypothetical protein BASA83_010086 [Batrachochytrium salamandrivorans]